MGGGLMQLVAYGAQDVYLTGNPQITLFKVVYRRHTNFSMECIELPIDTLKPSGRTQVPILRNGDLATKTYLRVTVPDLIPSNSSYNGKFAWVRRLGHAMIKTVEILIGGSPIDKHYGTWLDLWYELTHTDEQDAGYRAMIGDVDELTTMSSSPLYSNNYVLHVPLQFWFCRNYGLALPLIALQYHEVRINLEMQDINNLICFTEGTNSQVRAPAWSALSYGSSGLLIDYIYLDSEERRRFAQVGHEYLIEQVQLNEANIVGTVGQTQNQTFTLNFNHPCKELIWAHRLGAYNGNDVNTRFLAYTNKDEAGSWDEAVRVAAENIIKGLLMQSSTTNVNTNIVVITATNAANPVTVATVDAQGANELVVNSVNTSTATVPTTMYLQLDPQKLLFNGVPIAKYINVVTIYYSNTASAFTVSSVHVELDDQSIPLEILSVPLTDTNAWTDNRVATVAADALSNDTFVVQLNNYGVRLDGKGNPVKDGNLVLNGHDRFSVRDGRYFNYVQPYQHHTHTPADGINDYSFGLHPEQHQPSGTCNMSRIDNARLTYKTFDPLGTLRANKLNIYTGTVVYIYATNYNVMRVLSGMGGLAYSS